MEMMTQEIRDRIFAAADELYQQNGCETFPTVDAVRRLARVNMNDASSAMKEWRRQRTAKVAQVAVQVPETVLAAATQAMAVMWQQAQDLANESLKAAQSGWESERAELDALRAEMGDAYQSLEDELSSEHARIAGMEKALDLAATQTQAHDQMLAALRQDLAAARHDAEQARAAVAVITADLARSEALREAEQVRASQSAAELDALRARLDAIQGERDQARQEVAGLAGQTHAMREQIAALLVRIPAPRERKAAPAPKQKRGKRVAPEFAAVGS